MWRCGVCGLVYEGAEPPEKCPKCGAPKEKFSAIPEEEMKLIERSRFTNALHAEIFSLLGRVVELAEAGAKDNLDPGCVKIFNEEVEAAKLFMQKIKAELETHMKKGKWG